MRIALVGQLGDNRAALGAFYAARIDPSAMGRGFEVIVNVDLTPKGFVQAYRPGR